MLELFKTDGLNLLSKIGDNSIDLVLTDPPYLISSSSGMQELKDKGIKHKFSYSIDFGDWDRDFDITPFISEFYRVLKPSGTLITWFDLWKLGELKTLLEQNKFSKIRMIEWIKTNPVPLNQRISYLSNCREIAILGIKGTKPTFNSKYDKGIYEFPICKDKGRFHPTQKPLALFKELILKHSNENDKILDCFSGSGTTMVACQQTNRQFIGSEICLSYFSKSLLRLL